MDTKTIEKYNETAQELAGLHRDLTPVRLYELTQKFFKKEAPTLDLGCGIGRDTKWLSEQGYRVIGLDASEGMLAVARKEYPQLNFIQDSLPELKSQKDASYSNVFCSAVLMHVPHESLRVAMENILRITEPAGRIILSVRATENDDQRENEKLYADIIPEILEGFAKDFGGKLLLSVENYEESRKLTWDSYVFEKGK